MVIDLTDRTKAQEPTDDVGPDDFHAPVAFESGALAVYDRENTTSQVKND